METKFFDNQLFESNNYSEQIVRGIEFQECTFKKCSFLNSNFAGNKFLDCKFDECDLSMMKLNSTFLQNSVFKDCKMLGVNFSECQDFLFSVSFKSCLLDYTSFAGKKMIKTNFTKCSLKQADFTQANLSGSVFEEVDLTDAVFLRTNLTEGKLETAYNYSIDPEINVLKKARFSVNGVAGLLSKYVIKIIY